jgi:hypothetical protein
MSEWLIEVVKDLPSTGILLLFLYLVNEQVKQVISLFKDALTEQTNLLKDCMSKFNRPP